MTKPTSLSSPSSSWVYALLCQTLVSTTYGLCFSDRKDGRKVWKLIGRWSENEREKRKKMKSREREKGEEVKVRHKVERNSSRNKKGGFNLKCLHP